MKFHITFKNPDAIDDSFEAMDLSDDEKYEIREKLEKWIRYQELITIEFDTENNTANVVVIK